MGEQRTEPPVSEKYGLVGYPDYLVRRPEGTIPVELKTGPALRWGRTRARWGSFSVTASFSIEDRIPSGAANCCASAPPLGTTTTIYRRSGRASFITHSANRAVAPEDLGDLSLWMAVTKSSMHG